MRGAFPGKYGEECHSDRQKKMVSFEGVPNDFSDSLISYILPGTEKTTKPPRFPTKAKKQKREISQPEQPMKKARVEKDDMDVVESDEESENTTNDDEMEEQESEESDDEELDPNLDEKQKKTISCKNAACANCMRLLKR